MGRMADAAYEHDQIEQEIAIARIEAADDALPKSYAESLETIQGLRFQLGNLVSAFDTANSSKERNKERAIGFGLGILASLIAALVWWFAAGHWTVLKN